jgi:uncharacterized OB-fold protein
MAAPDRPQPRPDDLSRPFWEAAAAGRLEIQHCEDCGYYNHPPKPLCDRCNSPALAYLEVSGRGRVYSYTTNHQKNVAGFEPAVPYTNLIVELQEQPGLLLISDLAGRDASWVRIGAPVRVTFERLSDAITLPQFAPGGD